MFASLAMMWLSLSLTGCAPKKIKRPQQGEAIQVVELMRARKVPFALQARFHVRVEGPDVGGSTVGALILHRPDRFRIEIQTPVRTPFLYLASNGQSMHAWVQQNRTFYRGDRATEVIAELTEGAMSAADVMEVFTGGLPLPDAKVTAASWGEDGMVDATLDPGTGHRVQVRIDPRNRLLIGLVVESEEGEDLLAFEVTDEMHFRRARMPEEMTLYLPGLGWTLEVEVHTWDELGVIPEVFDLAPPRGATEADLVESLRAMSGWAAPEPAQPSAP
jgi:hypothetical protein